MPVSTTGIEYQVAPGTFAVDLGPLGRQADLRPLADQVLAQVPHPTLTQGCFIEGDVFPDPLLINPPASDGDMHMGMPVKTPAVSVDGAEDAHFKSTLSCRVEQVIDGQAADVIE